MMPTNADPSPRNPSGWLLADADRTTELMESAISERRQAAPAGVLRTLGKISKASLGRQIVTALEGIVPSDLVTVFRGAWGDYRELREVAAQSAGEAPTEHLHRLKDQQICYAQEPSFAVVVNGETLFDVKAKVDIAVSLTNARAVIRAGRLIRVEAGRSSITGTILVEQQEIVRKTASWPDEFTVHFNPGIGLTGSTGSLPVQNRRSAFGSDDPVGAVATPGPAVSPNS